MGMVCLNRRSALRLYTLGIPPYHPHFQPDLWRLDPGCAGFNEVITYWFNEIISLWYAFVRSRSYDHEQGAD